MSNIKRALTAELDRDAVSRTSINPDNPHQADESAPLRAHALARV
ncbi:hypothetical protein HCH_06754 [Hahella chejuensis KCTC 2396]|uniref:Uncharacterized protein n=1 Tax=Hahella chejuensis (strain KCTC 2396) TaxID=349521 RepID=Q2S7J5_HAHCH|nr:hypothetical protein [Hahella chejuensis]ABC33379.1 hypothetical protein HCH_06754 [Hahella chejuensis KCTC 2396]